MEEEDEDDDEKGERKKAEREILSSLSWEILIDMHLNISFAQRKEIAISSRFSSTFPILCLFTALFLFTIGAESKIDENLVISSSLKRTILSDSKRF